MSETISPTSKALKIGIVGFGPFAQFLAKTMIKQGHFLQATSRSDYTHLCSQMGIVFFRDMNDFFQEYHDVILISTSILSFSDVLKTMPFGHLKHPTLFVDVLSVKEHPRNVFLQVLPENADILCTHPMFGPESGNNGWKDLAFVYEKIRITDEVTCSSFLNIFGSEGCKMLEMSCEEHDKQAAKSQFIAHTIGRTLSEMDIKSTSLDTKGFQSLNQLKETTVKASFDLFSGLYIYNRFANEELQQLEIALQRVKDKLRNIEAQQHQDD